MYRVYVIRQGHSGSEVLTDTRTTTPSSEAAEAAFWGLHAKPFDAAHLLLMTRDGKQHRAYRYGSRPGDPDYITRPT